MREKAIQRLTEYGFRPSLQRIAIVEYLLTHSTHPVVDTIFNELSSSIPTLSKTTVYNTLKMLAEKGAILQVNIENNVTRYDGDIKPHAHFKCNQCGKIIDLEIQGEMKNLSIKEIEKYKIFEQYYIIKGLCPFCQEK